MKMGMCDSQYEHGYTHTRMHAHTHKHMHARTHTHTDVRTHTSTVTSKDLNSFLVYSSSILEKFVHLVRYFGEGSGEGDVLDGFTISDTHYLWTPIHLP